LSSAPQSQPAQAAASFHSIPDMWAYRVGSTPRSQALYHRERTGRGWAPTWSTLTWAEADARVRAIAGGLLAHGLEPEHRVAILANTCVEWILTDIAIQYAAGATTAIHAGSTDAEIRHILHDSASEWVFVDSAALAARVTALRGELPSLRGVISYVEPPPAPEGEPPFVHLLSDWEVEGRTWNAAWPAALDATRRSIGPSHLSTLIYTSGTTGVPKGVELTHDAWVYQAEAIDKLDIVNAADKQFLFLPLAHVFARVMELVFIRLGVPTAVDGVTDRLPENLVHAQPTWMACAPRVLEKMHNEILRRARAGGIRRWLTFKWALDVGKRASALRQRGERLGGLLRMEHALAERLVYRSVAAMFGGRLRFVISGGAPLSKEIAEFFHALDVLVCEGYGLTESSAASCTNTPLSYVFGTVGRPLPGCELRVAPDGEILLRSRGVMRGYHNLPAATAEALVDGWLHTGDIGRVLDSGHLQITDRKKDLIVTSTGKNIAPSHFQSLLAARSTLVSQVVLHGDRRPFCIALVTLREEEVRRWADEEGLAGYTLAELVGRPELRMLVQQAIDDVNRELPPWERARRFTILPEDFSIENGLLTPTLKPRRKEIVARFAKLIDGFYDGAVLAD
jgi:long-chain acyl-CoA synthetase